MSKMGLDTFVLVWCLFFKPLIFMPQRNNQWQNFNLSSVIHWMRSYIVCECVSVVINWQLQKGSKVTVTQFFCFTQTPHFVWHHRSHIICWVSIAFHHFHIIPHCQMHLGYVCLPKKNKKKKTPQKMQIITKPHWSIIGDWKSSLSLFPTFEKWEMMTSSQIWRDWRSAMSQKQMQEEKIRCESDKFERHTDSVRYQSWF